LAWAALSALRRPAARSDSQQRLLAAGLLPILGRLREYYLNADNALSPPEKQPVAPKALKAKVTTQVPAFVHPHKPANHRTETVKQRWLRGSSSLPEIPVDKRRSALAWLAGTPAPSSRGGEETVTKRPVSQTLLPEGVPAARETPQRTPLTSTKVSGRQLPKWPSVTWLVAEDGVEESVLPKMCDRSMLLLQANALIRQLTAAESHGGRSHQ